MIMIESQLTTLLKSQIGAMYPDAEDIDIVEIVNSTIFDAQHAFKTDPLLSDSVVLTYKYPELEKKKVDDCKIIEVKISRQQLHLHEVESDLILAKQLLWCWYNKEIWKGSPRLEISFEATEFLKDASRGFLEPGKREKSDNALEKFKQEGK